MFATYQSGMRELDSRRHDGIAVTLLWEPPTNRVFVAVRDERLAGSFEIEVDPAHALDAFRHPYAYAASTAVPVAAAA